MRTLTGGIVDAHAHALLRRRSDGTVVADIGRYRARARAAGIGESAVFANLHHDYREANAAVALLVHARRAELHGVVFVHCIRDMGRIGAMVRWAVDQHQFCCIKVHRRDAALTDEVCDAALDRGVPILYDIMGEVDSVVRWATRYPRINFIIPHFGSFQEDVRAQMAFLGPLAEYPNVYTDTSGVRYFDLIMRALEVAGAHKVLFGSDGPWLHPAVELAKIRALQLADDDEALVLGDNFRRLTRPTFPGAGSTSARSLSGGNTGLRA